jgi:hypothetical protein
MMILELLTAAYPRLPLVLHAIVHKRSIAVNAQEA